MKRRSCPLCNSRKNKLLYIQKFANNVTHQITCCLECGFVFVRNTPNEEYYAKYYRSSSIYEFTRDENLHEKAFNIMKKYTEKNDNILDVGCSTGNLLYLFKKSGYPNLVGIDPAPNCRKIAKEKFNIKVVTADLKSFNTRKRFNLVILNNVLEHLWDVRGSIRKIKSLLSNDGHLYIAVPDAGNFYKKFDEPFGEFSTEHINFFSIESLHYLLSNFSPLEIMTDNRVIYSLWKMGSTLKHSMQQYIKLSESKLSKIRKLINSLPDEVLVWGAGSLTQRLLSTTNLKPYKIIDRNPNLIGETIKGVEIIAPEEVKKYNQPILISSYRFKKEIVAYIKEHFKNKFIVLN